MKILVFGAGAVGGYFGGRLVQIGADITFFVRKHRSSQIKHSGLKIFSPHGDFKVNVKTMTIDEEPEKFDLVILACKAFNLKSACQDIKKIVKEKALILPLLNGISHLNFLKNFFGEKYVLGGAAHIAAVLTRDGSINQLNPIQILTIGDLNKNTSSISKEFAELCKPADFSVIHSKTIEQAMWDKWTFLATLASSTILFRNTVGAITESKLGADLMLRIYDECLIVADAENQKVSDKAKEKALSILMKPGSDFTSSMLRDLLMKKPTEHEQIIGDLIIRAKKNNIDVPLLSSAYINVVAENSKYKLK